MSEISHLSWHNCYKQGWGKEIVPEAYGHPAKAARGLARRIYAHAIERGYLRPGDTCLDPFAGIGGFALDALANGLNWFGAELERNFVDVGAGCDCAGISKADWVACFGRWKRFAHKDGHHWCPRCLAEAEGVIDKRKAPKLTQVQAKRRARMRELMTKTGRRVDFRLYVPIPFPESRRRHKVETLRLFGAETLAASYERNSGKIPHTEPHRYAGNLDLFAKHTRNGATAVLVQGDSRNLVKVLEGARAEGLISSPPFGQAQSGSGIVITGTPKTGELSKTGGYRADMAGTDPLNLGNMPTGEPPQAVIASPPYAGSHVGAEDNPYIDVPGGRLGNAKTGHLVGNDSYGDSDGQLAAMREGDAPADYTYTPGSLTPTQFDARAVVESITFTQADKPETIEMKQPPGAIISSPPWTSTSACEDPNYRTDRQTPGGPLYNDYGNSDGQLAALPEGEPPAGIVSSPPYEGSLRTSDEGDENVRRKYPGWHGSGLTGYERKYSDSPDQLGNQQGDTFWSAARAILDQCYAVLAPGGVAIWVLKAFVRNKAIVDFPGQWEALCNSCGLETVEVIRTHLVEDRGEQFALNGDLVKRKVRRFSFFRRLHVKKYPHLAINWEIVLITRKGVA